MKMLINKSNQVLIIIFTVFIISRLIVFSNHFTHYDDLYGPYIINVINEYENEKFIEQINKYGLINVPVIGNIITKIINSEVGVIILKYILGPIAISQTSTYAPLQFYLSGLFLKFAENYSQSLIAIRLPSVIFGLISLIVWINITSNYKSVVKKSMLMIGMTILTTSWMLLIYSSQGENFSGAVLSILIIYKIFIDIQSKVINTKKAIVIGLALVLLITLSYQTLIFIPGFIIGYYYTIKNRKIVEIKNLAIIIIMVLVGTIIIYKLFLTQRLEMNPGVHWNAGFNKQFYYNNKEFDNQIYNVIKYSVQFFYENIPIMIYGIIGFTKNLNYEMKLYVTITILLIICGIKYIAQNNYLKPIGVFTLVTIIVWISLIIYGKLTLSPTRHSLVLIVPIIIFMSLGVTLIIEKKYIYEEFLEVFCLIIIIVYIMNFKEIYDSRRDLYRVENIQNLIEEYEISEIITYDNTMNFEFENIKNKKYTVEYNNKYPYTLNYKRKEVSNYTKKRILILCISGDLCGNKHAMYDALKNRNNINELNQIKYKILYTKKILTDTTNCFGNLAGAGKNSIDLNVVEEN